MLRERWMDIARFIGLYQVSSWGRVKALKRAVPHRNILMHLPEKMLKPWRAKSGYLYVTLSKGGLESSWAVHRLVLEAFVGLCPLGMECCHFPDRDPRNNRLDNLRWDSYKANSEDRIKHGISCRRKSYENVPRGSGHPFAKLTEELAKAIKIELTQDASRGNGRRIARKFCVSEATICDIKHERTWKHVK